MIPTRVYRSAVFGLAAFLASAGRPSSTQAQTTAPVVVPGVAVPAPPATRPAPAPDSLVTKLETLTITLDVKDQPFAAVLDQLLAKVNTSHVVDWKAIETEGIKRDTPVSMRLDNVRASKAFELLLKTVETDDTPLAFEADDGVLTVTTRHQLDKDPVTRRYDINDLLFVPGDYSNAPDLTAPGGTQGGHRPDDPKPSRIERIDAVKKYISENVDPNSWKDTGGDVGTISSSPLRAILLIRQTRSNHAKILSVLDNLREGQSLQVSVETRFVMVDEEILAKAPEAVAKHFQDHDIKSIAGRTVDPDAIIRFVQSSPDSTSLTAPRLTLFSGQRATLSVTSTQPYTRTWSKTVVTTKDGTATATYQPCADTFVKNGIILNVQGTVAPDRKSVMLDIRPQVVLFSALVTEPWADCPPGSKLSVGRPVVLISKTSVSGSIPDGTTMMFDCGGFSQSGPSPTQPAADPVVVPQASRTKKSRLFMLVKPTILKAKSAENPAPTK